MDASPGSGRKRPRVAVAEEEKQETEQLRELEQRLESVRSTKLELQRQVDQLNTEAKRLEAYERKSRQHVEAQATKLTRMQQLQDEAAQRREQEDKRRAEEELARKQREEEERLAREKSVDVKPSDADLDNLEAFLAGDL